MPSDLLGSAAASPFWVEVLLLASKSCFVTTGGSFKYCWILLGIQRSNYHGNVLSFQLVTFLGLYIFSEQKVNLNKWPAVQYDID